MAVWGVDHELLGCWVVGGGGANRRNVRAVTGLRHCKTARCVQSGNPWQEGFVMVVGAQVENCRSKQSPLDTELYLQRSIPQDQLLKA